MTAGSDQIAKTQPIERFIEHQGGRLRYLVVGNGPPLVLVHGGNGSAENFDTWYQDLGAERTLVIPDLPGFGVSEHLRSKHDAAALSFAIDAVIDDIGADQVDLGGLCLGACVALAFYRRRPAMVDRLILHTPLISPPLITQSFKRQVRFMTLPLLFPAFTWMGRQRRISDWYKRHFTEGLVEGDTGADINFINQQRCYPRASREWVLDAIVSHDLDLVRDHRGPTLMMVAADDRIADIDALVSAFSDIPDVQLAIFEDAGHGWGADFVRRQNSVLVAFLRDAPFPATARLRAL